jgi:hypothetical protein
MYTRLLNEYLLFADLIGVTTTNNKVGFSLVFKSHFGPSSKPLNKLMDGLHIDYDSPILFLVKFR